MCCGAGVARRGVPDDLVVPVESGSEMGTMDIMITLQSVLHWIPLTLTGYAMLERGAGGLKHTAAAGLGALVLQAPTHAAVDRGGLRRQLLGWEGLSPAPPTAMSDLSCATNGVS
jgi:hypothetical protein